MASLIPGCCQLKLSSGAGWIADKQEKCEQDHGNTNHVYGDVDLIMVIAAIL